MPEERKRSASRVDPSSSQQANNEFEDIEG